MDLKHFSPTPIPQKIRLGHQMEYVFKQVLDYCSNYDVLIHNLPIRKGKQTIGEIDYILLDKETQQLIHVELTYKSYIINPNIFEPLNLRPLNPKCIVGYWLRMADFQTSTF